MVKINKYFIPYIFFLLYIGYKGNLLLSFCVVFMHELTHYMVARKLGFKGFDIEIFPLGFSLNLEGLEEATTKEDLIISISGPLLNILLSMIFYFLYFKFHNYYLYSLYLSNLIIGIFNFIPAFPLDGGRILRDILCFKTFYREANRITMNISIIIGILLMFLYIFLFMKEINNFSLGIASLFIIISSLKEKERIAYIIMTHIVKKKYKFIKKGYIENKDVSIYYKVNLLQVLSLIDKSKYTVFTVLDDDMKVIDILYEEEIVEGLKSYGNLTLEEFIDVENEEFNNKDV
ncbi:metalloprotease [Clostridium niameyense]|uniref:Metalloprotease n=1 Tax=Clostridium niameyense TaxID=1622073 RepID=A0A6M0R7I8_9CLOT|nr:M50 family metallopeptidase [Clostridium niameyense]NEZ45670.1 metalloprotease [Clostridium niameyense]